MSEIIKFKSFVFLDLESTGLPCFEFDGKTKITEICMICVSRNHLLNSDNCLPRVLHKITLPVNPKKIITESASSITGLNNFLLENELPLNEKKAATIKNFLDQCPKPLCLIAHNGLRFDFPLLKAELKDFDETIPGDVCCADSLIAFRELSQREVFKSSIRFLPGIEDTDLELCKIAEQIEDKFRIEGNCFKETMERMQQLNETTPNSQIIRPYISYKPGRSRRRLFFENDEVQMTTKVEKLSFKLGDLYERLFHETVEDSHRAEGDVIALIKCCTKFGEPILEWFEKNKVTFNDIKPM